MKMVFRADASNVMGTGHLMRCLTLAEALRERGAEIGFITRAHAGNLIHVLSKRGMPVTVLPSSDITEPAGEGYAAWLGVAQAMDAAQTVAVLGSEKPDWLVVDHYGIDACWERAVRPYTVKLMVIDDLADRQHDCDVLLDQNYAVGGAGRYAAWIPETCKMLAGPRYALLRPEYAAYRKVPRGRHGGLERVLVFMGGADPGNLTALVLAALSTAELSRLCVDVVIGVNNPHHATVMKQAENRPNTTVHTLLPDLARLMAAADIAIGAGGATTWERMCLGLPTVLVTIAENQEPAAKALMQANLVIYLGRHAEVTVERLVQTIRRLQHEPETLAALSLQNQLLVDGHGAARVAETLWPTHEREIRLRPARADDLCTVCSWIDESLALTNALPEVWRQYQDRFSNDLQEAGRHLIMLEAAGLPVGLLRFDSNDPDVFVDYALDPVLQGRLLEPYLVASGFQYLKGTLPVYLDLSGKTGHQAGRPPFLRMVPEKRPAKGHVDSFFSIAIISDQASWLNDYIRQLQLDWLSEGHRVLWVHDAAALSAADFCFFLGCGQIIPAKILAQYRHNLVVHESNLPKGKGWSPLTWQILEGQSRIPVTLLEATERVDSGRIYAQEWLEFAGHELLDTLHHAQAAATMRLVKNFVDGYPYSPDLAREQSGPDSFYPRRRPADSELDPDLSIRKQFDLLRVVDNDRYPAFFLLNGKKYRLTVTAWDDERVK